MPSPEVERVNELQRLIQSGQEPPLEVMQAAIRALREERGYAGEVKATKVRKAKEIAQIDIAELFKPKPREVPEGTEPKLGLDELFDTKEKS